MLIGFRERGREEVEGGERERETCARDTSICCLPYAPQQGLNPQPRCVSWPGLNPQPFGVQDNTPTNWATWPGLWVLFLNNQFKIDIPKSSFRVAKLCFLSLPGSSQLLYEYDVIQSWPSYAIVSLSPPYRWENWGSERVSDMPTVKQLVRGPPGIQAQAYLTAKPMGSLTPCSLPKGRIIQASRRKVRCTCQTEREWGLDKQ